MLIKNFFLILSIASLSISGEHRGEVDVVFIVDNSAQTNEMLFRQELLLIPQIISQLSYNRDKIRFGLITYSDHATLQMGLGRVVNNKALLEKLWRIKNSESKKTSLCFALRFARTEMFKEDSNRKKFVIVFPNTMWNLLDTTSSEVHLLKNMGVKILMVVIGDYLSRGTVMNVIESDKIIYRPHVTLSFIQKKYIYNFIINNINEEILDPIIKSSSTASTKTPSTTSSLSTRRIFTTDHSLNSATTYKSSESVTNPFKFLTEVTTVQRQIRTIITPPNCDITGKIVLLIDASSSISEINFHKLIDSCNDIVNTIRSIKTNITIAIVTYGGETVINLSFEDYKKTDIEKLVTGIMQRNGTDGLAAALISINEKVFGTKQDFFNRKTMIIFTTKKHINGADPILIADYMRYSNSVHFVAVRIGNNTDKWVNDTSIGKGVINVSDFDDLVTKVDNIINLVCEI